MLLPLLSPNRPLRRTLGTTLSLVCVYCFQRHFKHHNELVFAASKRLLETENLVLAVVLYGSRIHYIANVFLQDAAGTIVPLRQTLDGFFVTVRSLSESIDVL